MSIGTVRKVGYHLEVPWRYDAKIELRRKFILINLLLVGLVLAVVFGLFVGSNARRLAGPERRRPAPGPVTWAGRRRAAPL